MKVSYFPWGRGCLQLGCSEARRLACRFPPSTDRARRPRFPGLLFSHKRCVYGRGARGEKKAPGSLTKVDLYPATLRLLEVVGVVVKIGKDLGDRQEPRVIGRTLVGIEEYGDRGLLEVIADLNAHERATPVKIIRRE